MSHEVWEKMVYSFEQPMWHALQKPSFVPKPAVQVINEDFKGGYSIATRPVTVELNGAQVETGDFAVVRESSAIEKEEVVFGYCTERYNPLQPIDVAKTFDANVGEKVETMAFLKGGQTMFITWQMPSFEVTVGDPVDLFGLVKVGFDTFVGSSLMTTSVRVVCQNTLAMAENWAKQNTDGTGKGNIYKGRGVNKHQLRDLGYWMAHVQSNAIQEANLLRSFFGKLAQTPVSSDVEVHEILFEAFPPREDVSKYYPKELKTKKEEAIATYNEKQGEIRDGIYALFAGAGTAITPNYWGVLNSATEYFCHYQPSKKPIAESVMFGARQKNSMQVVKVLSERV